MYKSTLIALVSGAAIATAVAGLAGYSLVSDETPAADNTQTPTPEQNCRTVQTERQVEPRDDKEIAGTAIGAVVGGAVGRDVGDSDLTTAAGAAAGAYAGKKAQQEFQENRTESETEVRCD